MAIIITPSLIISMVTSLLRPFRTLPWWGTSFLLPSSLEKEPGTRFRVDARMKYTLCGDCRYAGLGLWYPEYAQKHVDVAQMQLHNMWNYEKWQELDIYPHITSKLKKNGKQSCQKIGQTMLWDIYVEKHCRQTMVSNIYARHSDEKFLEATICYRFCQLQKLCFSTASLSVWEFLEPLLTQNMSFFKSSEKNPNSWSIPRLSLNQSHHYHLAQSQKWKRNIP